MLTIKIEENYKDAIDEMGVSQIPGMYVMAMRDGDLLMGIGTMRIFDSFASIDKIVMKDEFKSFDLEFGMGKSLLNCLDLKGIRHVVSNIDDERLITALRFKDAKESEIADLVSDDWKYCLNLDGYFTSNC